MSDGANDGDDSGRPWRRVVWTLPNRAALTTLHVPYGLYGGLRLTPQLGAHANEQLEIELVLVEELMVFHIRGAVVEVSGQPVLHIAPFDRGARDVIMGFAQGKNLDIVQRRARRFPVHVEVEYTDQNEFVPIIMSDVNAGGAFIESQSPPPSGTLIALRLPMGEGEEPLVLTAEVAWTGKSPRAGFGVRFSTADPAKMERLKNWLAKMTRK